MMPEESRRMSAHGRSWPIFSRPVLTVSLLGYVEGTDADALEKELRRRLDGLGFDVKVTLTNLNYLQPTDQLEKNRLDEDAIKGGIYERSGRDCP